MFLNKRKKYLYSVLEVFLDVPFKKRFTAFLFTLICGILCIIPFGCVFINLIMQHLGIKWVVILCIIAFGIFLHTFLSVMYTIYYFALNELNKDGKYFEKLSYKELFLYQFLDFITIMFIIVIIIGLIVFVNLVLY